MRFGFNLSPRLCFDIRHRHSNGIPCGGTVSRRMIGYVDRVGPVHIHYKDFPIVIASTFIQIKVLALSTFLRFLHLFAITYT